MVEKTAASDEPGIELSGRESMFISDRIALLKADLFTPPFAGVGEGTRAVSQPIHDLKLTIGCIRNTIELYERARERGRTDEELQKGANLMLSDVECYVLAWRRGGHREYLTVRARVRAKHPLLKNNR